MEIDGGAIVRPVSPELVPPIRLLLTGELGSLFYDDIGGDGDFTE